MACYLGKEYTDEHSVIVSELHDLVQTELESSSAFRNYKGNIYLYKTNLDKIREGTRKMNAINYEFGFGTKIVRADSKRQVHIDVNPVAEHYISTYEDRKIAKDDTNDDVTEGHYFQLEDKESNYAPSEEIYAKLFPVLEKLGITVTTFENYKESYKERTGKELPGDIVGFASIFEKIIALDQDKEVAGTLPEEVMHFVVEAMIDDYRVQRSIDLILANEAMTSSEEWSTYMEKYNNDERKVAKEFLGQLASEYIVDKVINNDISSRLRRLIQRIFDYFMGRVRANSELNTIVRSLANTTLNNKVTQIESLPKEYYFSMRSIRDSVVNTVTERSRSKQKNISEKLITITKDENGKVLEVKYDGMYSNLQQIYDKLKQKYQRLYLQKKPFDKIKAKTQLNNLYTALVTNKATNALLQVLDQAQEDIDSALEQFENLEKNVTTKNPVEFARHLRELRELQELYTPLVSSVQDEMTYYDPAEIPDDTLTEVELEVEKEIVNAVKILADVLSSELKVLEAKLDRAGLNTVTDYVWEHVAINKEITSKEDVRNMLLKGDDISFQRRWMMGMAESRNDILAGIQSAIDKLISRDRFNVYQQLGELDFITQELKDSGIRTFEWMYETFNGEITGNFVTRHNWGKYRQAIKDNKAVILETFGLPEDRVALERVLNSHESKEFKDWFIKNKDKPIVKKWTKQAQLRSKEGINQRAIIQHNLNFEYKKNWNKWFAENTQTNPQHAAIVENYLRKFYEENLDKDEQSEEVYNYMVRALVPDHNDFLTKDYNGEEIDLSYNQRQTLMRMQDWLFLNRGHSQYLEESTGDGYYYKGDLLLPSADYNNPQFDDLQRNKNKLKYYEKLMAIKKEYDGKIPGISQLERAPQIRKDLIDRVFLDKNIMDGIREAYNESFKFQEDDTEYGTTLLDENYNKVRTVPIHYINYLQDQNNLALDPTRAMALYVAMASNYSTLTNYVDVLELSYDVVAKRQILGKEGNLKTLSDSREVSKTGGKTADLLRDALDSLIYGETKLEEIKWGINWGKVADVFNKYVSLNGLGLNLAASITNVVAAKQMHRQEALANEYFNYKELVQADKLYAQFLPEVMKDVGSLTSRSKLRHFGNWMEFSQDFNKNVFDTKANRNRMTRMMDDNILYFGIMSGEHYTTYRTGIALVNREKLTLNGEPIKLFPDGIEVKDNVISLKKGIKKEDGTDFTLEDLNSLKRKITSINQRLIGVYNNNDRGMIKRSALGRIGMVFRSWMPASINRRWSSRYFDYRTNDITVGMYRTWGSYMWSSMKDMALKREINFRKNYADLSQHERANFIRTTTEFATILFLAIAINILSALGDDDDDNYLLAIAAVQANRVYTELFFYTNPIEILNIMQSPAAGIRNVELLFKLFNSFNVIESIMGQEPLLRRYKGGRHNGQVYLGVNALKLIPPIEQIDRWIHPEELLEFYNR